MSNQKRVPHYPRLSAAVTFGALVPVAAATRSEQTSTVSKNTGAPRFIERDPEFNLRAEGFETHPGVVFKVLDELVLVQHAVVPLVQVVGQIPVEQRDHRLDARLNKIVCELDIMLEALLVDRVIASTERNDTRP